MSCLITYNNQEFTQDEFDKKYIPKQGEIIEYQAVEYMVHDANILGSQLLKGEDYLSLVEDGIDAQIEKTEFLNSIPIYNLDPVGENTVVVGGIDPIFNIPLTALLENGFEKTGKTFDWNKYKNVFGQSGNEADLAFQLETLPGSKASSTTIEKVKEWLSRIGIEVKDLDTKRYEGINGVTNLLEGVIQIAQGKENIALPEEGSHIAVEILKQTKSPLYTQMFNKISSYQIYKDMLNDDSPGSYKNRYRLADGKLDVVKLKEEAMGKVLAESLIANEEGSTERPELLVQSKNWWEQLKDWVRNLLKKAQFNPFEEAAKGIFELSPDTKDLQEMKDLSDRIDISKIQNGIYGGVLKDVLERGDYRGATSLLNNQLEDPNTFQKVVDTFLNGDEQLGHDIVNYAKSKEYLQIDNKFADDFVHKIDEVNKQYNLRKITEKTTINEEEVENAYVVTKDGKDLKTDRTTEYAKRENLKNTGGQDYFKNPTPEQKAEWDKKAMTGTNGHSDIENIIKAATEGGYLKNKEDISIPEIYATNKGVYASLVKFLLGDEKTQGFLQKFPVGTKFYTEKTVYNPAIGKAGRAGTIDLIAIPPKVEGQKQKIEIYDWKFMGFSLKTNKDIPRNKRQQHAIQLADYRNTIRKSILSKEDLENTEVVAQTVPIHATYRFTAEKVPILSSVQIGNINIKDEKNTYLLPVLAKDQSTGNPQVDQLVAKLEGHYKKIFQGASSEEEKLERKHDAVQLSIAIRNLQVKMNFDPLATEARSFQALVRGTLDKYKDITDPSILPELRDLANSAAVYAGIDEVFLSEYGKEELDEKSEKTLNTLKLVSREASTLENQILAKEAKILEGISQAELRQTILKPEVEVKGLIASVTEANVVGSRTVSLFTKLLNKARGIEALHKKEVYEKFLDLFFKAGGQSVYNKIAKKGKMELIDKVSEDFKAALKKAKEEGDKKFILQHINHEEAKALIQERIEKQNEVINERESINYYNEDDELNAKEAQRQRDSIVSRLDIFSKKFDGYDDRSFNAIFWKTMEIHEDNVSPEYKAIMNDKAVSEFYDYITQFNLRAKRAGYLNNSKSLRFLPLITGSAIEQMAAAGDKLQSVKNTLKETFTVQTNEERKFGQVGESGKQEKTIPTYYTRTDKEYEQLSKDLPKIFERYIESVLEFETNKGLESTYLSLLALERNKDHLQVENNRVVFEGDEPKRYSGNELNAQYLEKVGDDAIYGIQENNNTWVDLAIGKLSNKTEEEKQKISVSSKKVIEQGNSLTQNLAVGLRALVTIPNFVGANLQAIINAGGFYTWGEYLKNEGRMTGTAFSSKEKNKTLAAIDMFIPLNEDVAKEVRRESLYKNDKLAWLKSWSFKDIMMSSNRLPDKLHELTNALSWLDNTIIRDGKFVNIRQWLRSQPEYQSRYEDPATLKEKENGFNAKVEELKKEAITKIVEFKEGHPYIPGIEDLSKTNFGEYRTKILEAGRKNTGQMSRNNKADYRRSIIGRSFSMFKNWIIPQVQVRALDIQKNALTDEWEYGRFRLYLKVLAHLGAKNILKINDIKNATPTGIQIMRDILEQKKEDYYKKTGQKLEITEAEFFDMVRKELHSEVKELRLLLGLAALVLSAKLMAPDDDDNKNLYNMALKAVNKMYDEIGFYYNPLSIDSIQKGSILPSFGLVSKAYKLLYNLGEEGWGATTSDEDLMDKAHPLKYGLNLVPFASQFQNDVLPILFPEEAKDMGIRVSPLARQQ